MEQCFVADAYDDIRNKQINYTIYVFNLGLMGQDWIAIIYLGNRLGVRNRSNWVHLSQCGSYALTLSVSPVRLQVQVQVQHVADPIVTHIVWSLKTLKSAKACPNWLICPPSLYSVWLSSAWAMNISTAISSAQSLMLPFIFGHPTSGPIKASYQFWL